MSDTFDIYTIIFLVLAVFIFLRLRSVLGTRTGHEPPPYDPYTRREAHPSANENVVPLPGREAEAVPAPAADEPSPAHKKWSDAIEKSGAAADGLAEISRADSHFEVGSFLSGAVSAYEMIVNSFTAGEMDELDGLLASDVQDEFAHAIEDRKSRGEVVETTFISINASKIEEAEVRDGTAFVTIRFVSQVVNVVRDKDGALISGDPERIVEIVDVWTFARSLASNDPNWKLVATGAE